MINVTAFNPHKEEDEGYLAAEAGLRLADNPYPRGTIRFAEWRRGWHIKTDPAPKERHEGYLAAKASLKISQNPYPRGTIRYEEWRRGWHNRSDETERAVRLGKQTSAGSAS
jgi:hypothetical protein